MNSLVLFVLWLLSREVHRLAKKRDVEYSFLFMHPDAGQLAEISELLKVGIIRPVIEVVFVLGFVFTVKVFDVVIGLTQGGPANSTEILAPWAYQLSFQQFDYGAGAALNTVLLLIALLAAPIYIWLSRESLRRA